MKSAKREPKIGDRVRVMTLAEVETAKLGIEAVDSAGRCGGRHGDLAEIEDGWAVVAQQCRTFRVVLEPILTPNAARQENEK